MKISFVVAVVCVLVVLGHAGVGLVQTQFTKEFLLRSANATQTHYGDPIDGCLSDEIAIQIQGVSGAACVPKCSASSTCPTDVPAGCVATPECALQAGSSGTKYCALICSQGQDCGENASCKLVQGSIGVCTYDDDSAL